jgi:RNA polymerase sigma factor (TIGR02999 family)
MPDGSRPGAHADGGSPGASDLVPLVYDQLRALARHLLRGERRAQTLQPTALVHEAYLRLAALNRIGWRGRTHFLAMAATIMRRILVEHARRAQALKRGADAVRVGLNEMNEGANASEASLLDVLALDEALERLRERSPRQSRVAEMRVFAGMTFEEVGRALDVSDRTVKADWKVARAWLARELRPDGR